MSGKSSNNEIINTMKILSDEANLGIFMHLLIYHELPLSKLVLNSDKSRATIHRHLQSMLNAKLIFISRTEQIRGSIPANYYQVNFAFFQNQGQITPEQLEKVNPNQLKQFQDGIRKTNITVATIIKQNLDMLISYLQSPEMKKSDVFSNIFNLEDSKLFLAFNLLTSGQKQKYLQEFFKFSMKFTQEIQEQGVLNLEEEKPYTLITGLIPIKEILEAQNRSKSKRE